MILRLPLPQVEFRFRPASESMIAKRIRFSIPRANFLPAFDSGLTFRRTLRRPDEKGQDGGDEQNNGQDVESAGEAAAALPQMRDQ
jgi:hypothetical protein